MKFSIRKWLKKRRLIRKYERTDARMLNDIHLLRAAGDDQEMKRYFIHHIHCELRFVYRLKKL